MTKSEKNVLSDVIGMLNAIVSGNSEGDQTKAPENNEDAQEEAAPVDDKPSQEELEFVKSLKEDGEIAIDGDVINFTKMGIGHIRISSQLFGRMINAYLEKHG